MQLAFDFAEEIRLDRLYFAVLPDPAVCPQVLATARRLARQFGLTGLPRPAPLLHVSLRCVASAVGLPPGVVSLAQEAGSTVSGSPVAVEFDRASSFTSGTKRPLVLTTGSGSGELRQLRDRVDEAMFKLGVKTGAEQFDPHLTLLYDHTPIAETPLAEPISWTVRDFVLVHSLHGHGRHRVLGRWSLHQ